MNLDKVISGFFIILAMTLNFGFFYGDLTDLAVHSKYELLAAVVVNIIATTLKIGDKTQLGSVLLASSFEAYCNHLAARSTFFLQFVRAAHLKCSYYVVNLKIIETHNVQAGCFRRSFRTLYPTELS